jgi:hypothetical protein
MELALVLVHLTRKNNMETPAHPIILGIMYSFLGSILLFELLPFSFQTKIVNIYKLIKSKLK